MRWDEMEWRQKGDEENYYERLNRHESRYFIFLFMSVPGEEKKTEWGRKAHKGSLRSCLLFFGAFLFEIRWRNYFKSHYRLLFFSPFGVCRDWETGEKNDSKKHTSESDESQLLWDLKSFAIFSSSFAVRKLQRYTDSVGIKS